MIPSTRLCAALLAAVFLCAGVAHADAKAAAAARKKAQALLKKGDKAGAAKAFLDAAKADPADVASHNDAAFLLVQLKKCDAAREIGERALDSPKATEASRGATYYNLGLAYECTKDLDAARDAFIKSVENKFSKPAASKMLALATQLEAPRVVQALVRQVEANPGPENAARAGALAALEEVWTNHELIKGLVSAPEEAIQDTPVRDVGLRGVRFVSFDTGNGGTMPDTELHIVSCAPDGCAHHSYGGSALYGAGRGFVADKTRYLLLVGMDQSDSCRGEHFAEVWKYDPGTRAFSVVEGAFQGVKGTRVAEPWDCENGPDAGQVTAAILADGSLCLRERERERKFVRKGGTFVPAGASCD